MSHPCDGHACDHCYLCDVVGICCATVPSGPPAVAASCPDTGQLRQAVIDETKNLIGLSELLRLELTTPHFEAVPQPAALPPGPPAPDLSFDAHPHKEAEHVHAPRRHEA